MSMLSSSSEPASPPASPPSVRANYGGEGKMDTTPRAAITAKKKSPLIHLIAGGAAGLVESSVCHPLDTIKTRMQLHRQLQTNNAVMEQSSSREPDQVRRNGLAEQTPRRRLGPLLTTVPRTGAGATMSRLKSALHSATGPHDLSSRLSSGGIASTFGPVGTARRIVEQEGFRALYGGLSAVYMGIIPKMAIRFLSFEQYREALQSFACGAPFHMRRLGPGQFDQRVTFFAGLFSGLTEAILVVTPAEVCKIRMQSATIGSGRLKQRKYSNVVQTAYVIVKEEGPGALYKGVVPTMMRQGCNQAVNFTTYNAFKRRVIEWKKEKGQRAELEHWQSLLMGGISGGFGPMVNNPLDVVKTRMQKQVIVPEQRPKYRGILQSCRVIAKEEGFCTLWKGITPRLLRIMPGQAITFMTYEAISSQLFRWEWF